jgi:predicted cupin superfamily sugar epimerase
MTPEVRELVGRLALLPHPEGGFFRETYRSRESVARAALPERFSGDRAFSTAILYLLPKGATSRLHRIAADEVWHFHLGGPLALTEISSAGVRRTVLGPDLGAGHVLQHVVPAGTWFGGRPLSEYSLAGCTVAPGFDFADFEMGRREELLAQFPSARVEIEALT